MKKVGIFFFIDSEILMDAVAIEEGEAYGDALQHGGHYEYWEKLNPQTLAERKFKTRAYDAYPRGRVVYFPKKVKFHIYYDPCLGKGSRLDAIRTLFGLTGQDVEFAQDEHYQCANCNPHFLD